MDCDCYINNTTPDFVDRIVYCPLHAAAEATTWQRNRLREAAEEMLRVLREDEGYKYYNPVCMKARAAIVAAKGE